MSKRSCCCEIRCCFSMHIIFGDISFYNLSHVRCRYNQNYPKLSQEELVYPTKLLETSEKTLLDIKNCIMVRCSFHIVTLRWKKPILTKHKLGL